MTNAADAGWAAVQTVESFKLRKRTQTVQKLLEARCVTLRRVLCTSSRHA